MKRVWLWNFSFLLHLAEGSFPGAETSLCNLNGSEQRQTEVPLAAGLLDEGGTVLWTRVLGFRGSWDKMNFQNNSGKQCCHLRKKKNWSKVNVKSQLSHKRHFEQEMGLRRELEVSHECKLLPALLSHLCEKLLGLGFFKHPDKFPN